MKVFANKKTKVAHASNKRGDACRQAFLLKENTAKFQDMESARLFGYRACKRCKPE